MPDIIIPTEHVPAILSALKEQIERIPHEDYGLDNDGHKIWMRDEEEVEAIDAAIAAIEAQAAPATTEPVPAWEREFPPEWDRHPWANYACLIVGYSHYDGVTLRWEYFEQEPLWGEKSYNWVGRTHGFVNPVKRAPLSTFFDTRATLRQRPSAQEGVVTP